MIIQAELNYHYVLKHVKQFWTFLTIYGISGPKMEALFQFSVLLFNIIWQQRCHLFPIIVLCVVCSFIQVYLQGPLGLTY